MTGLLLFIILTTVRSHPAEDREMTMMQKDFNDLLLKLNEHHDSYTSTRDQAERSAIIVEIARVMEDLAALKDTIASPAQSCEPTGDEEEYKLCRYLEEAQAKHEALVTCHNEIEMDIVDVLCIGQTVEVQVVEEGDVDDDETDLDAMANVLDVVEPADSADDSVVVAVAPPAAEKELDPESLTVEELLQQGMNIATGVSNGASAGNDNNGDGNEEEEDEKASEDQNSDQSSPVDNLSILEDLDELDELVLNALEDEVDKERADTVQLLTKLEQQRLAALEYEAEVARRRK